MRNLLLRAAAPLSALAALAALSACATPAPETRVTRFHLGQPIAPGEVAVEPLDQASRDSLEFGTYAAAVSRELARVGFTIAPGVSKSELVATVAVARGQRVSPVGNGSGVSLGLGGGGFSGGRRGGGVGLGGGISFPIGKSRSRDIAATELSVQLKRRSDGTVVWEGRAQTEARAGTPAASPDVAAGQLATALFAGFPGESGRTVVVK